MKKWIKITLLSICLALFIGVIYFYNNKESDYNKFKHINYTETFKQLENEYIVYFYMENCSDCEEIEDKFKSYIVKNPIMPIYLVDMKKNKK